MQKRNAYDLKGVMIAYNAYQVLFSLWLCSQALKVKKPVQLLSHTCKNPSQNKEFLDVVSEIIFFKILQFNTELIFF